MQSGSKLLEVNLLSGTIGAPMTLKISTVVMLCESSLLNHQLNLGAESSFYKNGSDKLILSRE